MLKFVYKSMLVKISRFWSFQIAENWIRPIASFRTVGIVETNGTNLFFCLFWSVFDVQYNLDFRGLSPRGRSPRGDDDSAIATEGGKSSGGAGGDPSIWQFGMARRGKGDSRRTRVSFLLFWASSTTSATRFAGFQQRTLVQSFFFSIWHCTMLLSNENVS